MLNDVFFKALLCDDRHKELTLNFLNSILNRTGEQAFCDLEFLDKELKVAESLLYSIGLSCIHIKSAKAKTIHC